jgi:protein-S-isoprenylcysteine O-methyltransferase Ste14
MNSLTQRALKGTLLFHLALAVLIFGSALSLEFWQGWLYWFVFLACSLTVTLYFLRHDPALIERRLKAGPTAEREPTQKLILRCIIVVVCAAFVVPGLDHHFAWSAVPVPVVLAGDALVVVGYVVCFLVFRENSFASAIVEVGAGQTVVTTGPYAVVRHPMYSGALLIFLGTPLALGSWWGLVPSVPMTGTIVWRLLDEERYLDRNLPGYREYRQSLRWRLVPWVW